MKKLINGPFRVYVGMVSTTYLDPEAIAAVVRDGLKYCGFQNLNPKTKGPALLKPSFTFAAKNIGHNAYTHPVVLEQLLSAWTALHPAMQIRMLIDRNPYGINPEDMLEYAHGHNARFKENGYRTLENLFMENLEIRSYNECKMLRYLLSHGDVNSSQIQTNTSSRAANEIIAPQDYRESSCTVFAPKVSSDIITQGFSGAVHLARSNLHTKNDLRIVDALEICNPEYVISDAITVASGGSRATQRSQELGLIIVATNALAHDIVAAQALNLDPTRIPHLKIAMDRGWGPNNLDQIEIGGAGHEGVKLLAQKSRIWKLGSLPLSDFRFKFEQENPGHKFPFRVVPDHATSAESEFDQNIFLDFLYTFYDLPDYAKKMSRWPKASILIGKPIQAPRRKHVYVLGDLAIQSIESKVSTVSWKLSMFGIRFRSVQLKNSNRHLLIEVPGSPLGFWHTAVAFFIASTGRIRNPLFWIWLRSRMKKSSAAEAPLESCRTVLLPHNRWWALKF